MPAKHLGKRLAVQLTANRAVAMCITAALLLALIIIPPGGTAEAAAPSLPYIETLRTKMKTGSTFRVLEILSASDRSTGIDFYLPGHETNRLSEYPDFLAATTTAGRTTAAATWRSNALGDVYGMHGSDSDVYPLDIGTYAEAKYWDSSTTYPNILTLPAAESSSVTGIRTDAANGPYKTTYAVTLDATGGNQILTGGHLIPAATPGDAATRYYYDINAVSFTPLTASTAYHSALAGSAVYGKTAAGDYIFLAYYAPGVITPAHAETYADGGIYLVAGNQPPTSLTYTSGYYELVGATAVSQSGGYLSRQVERLTLVESGGDCTFTPEVGGETFQIFYDKIRYSGGFVNHNWFSRFVLDAESADIPAIQYEFDSHLIGDVAAFSTNLYSGYDLIVIGGGILSLPANLISAISGTAGVAPVPTLFFAAEPGVIAHFPGAADCDVAGNGNFVFGSMYFYRYGPSPSHPAPGCDAVFTLRFNENFIGVISGTAKGLQPVLDDINYENDLRAITGAPQLEKRVSIATTLRYILNQRQPRIVQPLSHVRILEIQPLYVATNSPATPGAKFLFASASPTDAANPLNILNWLRGLEITDASGSKHAVQPSDVTITRMSTAEFNGKIEDLNESYELIYIGDSRANFALNAAKTETVFAGDSTMNGLLYYNIGEPIVKTDYGTGTVYKPAGLLDSDWLTPTTINKVTNTATLRLPGNDISNAKRSELEDYINAGYPVIFAEDLVLENTDGLKGASYDVALTHAPTATEKVYTLAADVNYFAADGSLKDSIAALTADTVTGIFEWHRITEAGVDTIVRSITRTEPADTFTVDTNAAPGEYYCVYRLALSNTAGGTDPLGTSARSNTISASKDAVHIQIDGLPTVSASGTVSYTGADGITIDLPTLSATPAVGSIPAYITATLSATSHDALLDAYPDLKYIYTLEQYADPGTDSFLVGSDTFIGSSSADGSNAASVVARSAATTATTYTFSLTPEAGMLYRIRTELVSGAAPAGSITLSPVTRTDGSTTYYDYYAADFAPAGIGFAPLTEKGSSTTLPQTRSLIVHNFTDNNKPTFGKAPASGLSAVINVVGSVAPTANVTLTMQASMLEGELPPGAEIAFTLLRAKTASGIGSIPARNDPSLWNSLSAFPSGSNTLTTTISEGYVHIVKAELRVGGVLQSWSYTSGFRLSNSAREIQYNKATDVLAEFLDSSGTTVTTTVTSDPLVPVTFGSTSPALNNVRTGIPAGITFPVTFALIHGDVQTYNYLLQSRSGSGPWVDDGSLVKGDNTISMDLGKSYRIAATVTASASPSQTAYTDEFFLCIPSHPSNNSGGFALSKSVPMPEASGTTRSARLSVSTAGTPLGLTAGNITLTASANISSMFGSQNLTDRYTYTYQWEKDGVAISGATVADYTILAAADSTAVYRCVVTATETASNTAGSVAGAGLRITADANAAGMLDIGDSTRSGTVNDYLPSTPHVDRWTNLFQFMLDALAKNNVFSQADVTGTADGKRPSLRSFLTLSKPSIVFTKSGSGVENIPTPYTNTGGTMSQNRSGRQLAYGFKISDPADPTPASTTYNVHLYIDANASGKYTIDERVHIDVYTAANQLLTPDASGYRLYSNTEYRVEALLPTDIVGIVPWKLEVVKNSSGGNTAHYFHGSKIGYTRIKPDDGEKRTLTVLQIVGWDQYHQSSMNDKGTTVVLESNPLYQTLTSGLEDFDIRLNTIRNDGTCYQYFRLGGTYEGPIYRPESMKSGRNDLWQGLNINQGTVSTADFEDAVQKIYNELMYYDMLVIGFADCYEGVNDSLAHAILRYIESDKAVLFTHDTTSLNNMPLSVYTANVSSDTNGYWGYSFNQILRPALGLDYYGIVDPTFRSALAAQTAASKISPDTVNALKAAGYNIAYKPGSPTGELEEKTHGYATYYFQKPDPDYRPRNVTQLNAGQITTYPYNVNLAGFPNAPTSAGSTLFVAPTHFQYYALNMNQDDLVVWYALADDAGAGNFDKVKDANGNYYHTNDAANGYYIYTMGNVTYSGVGHHASVTEDEAKLFVNTMIAAYRSSALNAEVTAKDRNNSAARYMYFPADIFSGNQETVISNAATANNEMFAAYFSFLDASIKGGTSSISHARYYYSIGGADVYGDPQRMIPISGVETYEGFGAESVRIPSISRSQLYHFYIPKSVVSLLAEHNVIRIYFEVTTTYSTGETGIGHDSVELRKIGLLPLQ